MPVVEPVAVESHTGYRIWVRYADGSEGEVDLSDLAGRGVFRAWDERGLFDTVRITAHGSIAWGEEIELCADVLYLELTGKSVAEIMPGLTDSPGID